MRRSSPKLKALFATAAAIGAFCVALAPGAQAGPSATPPLSADSWEALLQDPDGPPTPGDPRVRKGLEPWGDTDRLAITIDPPPVSPFKP
ncbi:MAG: hypothetical protein AAF628_09505 [Planctomycetota bacterium]